jgi:hypothetical protein
VSFNPLKLGNAIWMPKMPKNGALHSGDILKELTGSALRLF